MLSGFGALEGQLLSWAQMTGTLCASNTQIMESLRLNPIQCRKLLDRMNRRGTIIQLKRGLYLLPQKLPPGGKWQPSPEVAIWYYMTSLGATWQETGPAAFNYYGLTEQVSNTTTVYNDKVSQTRKFGRLSVDFIKVAPARLGEIVEIAGSKDAVEKRRIGSFARIVMDAVYDYNRFGTLPKAYEWIAERKADKALIQSLVSCMIKSGNIASCRRIGWLLDRLDVDEKLITPIKNNLNASVYFIPADPAAPGKGRTNAVWNITENYLPCRA